MIKNYNGCSNPNYDNSGFTYYPSYDDDEFYGDYNNYDDELWDADEDNYGYDYGYDEFDRW